MRLIVKKPRNGRTTVILDDLRGATRKRERLVDVPLEDLEVRVRKLVDDWKEVRRAIYAARAGPAA